MVSASALLLSFAYLFAYLSVIAFFSSSTIGLTQQKMTAWKDCDQMLGVQGW
jgi:hypothetical protein